MGQERKRIRAQAASIRAKNVRTFWISELARRLGIEGDTAHDIATDIHDYLSQNNVLRELGTISLPVIAGRKYNAKRDASTLPRREAAVQLIAKDDADILEEYGNSAMLTARMARIIEDAYWADGIFNGPLLALLFPLSLRTLRSRLRKLWAQGATLPLCGTSHRYRKQWINLRPVLAIRRYLQGEKSDAIRRSLLISHAQWSCWWDQFSWVYHYREGEDDSQSLAAKMKYPEPLIAEWLDLIRELEQPEEFSDQRLMQLIASEPYEDSHGSSTPLTTRYLFHRYELPESTAQEILQMVRDFIADIAEKGNGQVVHFAACSQVYSSQSLFDSELCAVFLNYITDDDWERVDLQRPTGLRTERLKRLITEAYLQNSALALPDTAFLLGMSTDAVSNVLRNEEDTSLLIRGRVTILEPALHRAEEVIRMFCEEELDLEQICEKTGFERSRIKQYLRRFCQVVSLKRDGVEVSEVARRVGISPRAAQYCANLCDRLSEQMEGEKIQEQAFNRLKSRFSDELLQTQQDQKEPV